MGSTVEVTPAPAQALFGNPDTSSPQTHASGGVRNRNNGTDRRRNPEQQGPHWASAQQERVQCGQQSRRRNPGKDDSGRRGQRDSQPSNLLNLSAPPLDPPPGPGGGGTFDSRLTKDATNIEGEVRTEPQDRIMEDNGDEEEAEVCFICASPVVHNSVALCNHRTCHICALRLRALYKTRACAHCRVSIQLVRTVIEGRIANTIQTEASHVIFTDDASKRYEDYSDAEFKKTDDVLGIKYVQEEIHNDTVLLLRYNCPDVSCDIACWGWPDLHRHVKSVHHKILCDLCTRNKKVFTHEHELFTVAELRKHEKFGDDNPGAVDQSGFKGHPECGFCRQRFYGDDELYTHCREKHERCHICDRRNPGRQQQYFADYNSLELHFRNDHFLCSDRECLEKKFVVFESQIDLKAHQLDVHPNDLSKDARKDARRVDMTAFDYRTPHTDNRGRRDRDERGAGRGRDPNTESLPQSTAQPLRRDELAYQRQMAIQSAQSVSTRTFGGQLTPDASNSRNGARTQDRATANTHRTRPLSFPAMENLQINPSTSPSPQEQARRLQHASVTDRASAMLQNDPSKISTFRATVSSYRTSNISAAQLLDTFFTLFDVPSADLGKLIKELADIYETESKREELLKAWNDWRAINEDYPSLPGPSGILPGSSSATAGTGGGYRVLKLKSSTAQSSRSAVSKQKSWGNAATANPFPAISVSANRAGPGRVGPTPWIAPASSSSSASASVPSSRPSSRPPSSARPTDTLHTMFPALPAAAKPKTLIAGLTRGNVQWDHARGNSKNTPNPWAAAAAAAAAAAGTGAATDSGSGDSAGLGTEEGGGETGTSTGTGAGNGNSNGKKKAGKGKKQMLYKFG